MVWYLEKYLIIFEKIYVENNIELKIKITKWIKIELFNLQVKRYSIKLRYAFQFCWLSL